MRLVHLAVGRKHVVWAVSDENGGCQVLDMLIRAMDEYPGLTDAMMALLLEVVPDTGPPFEDPRRAKRLYRDLLYELKADQDLGRRQHLGLRVVFFFDDEDATRIVCTNAFYKERATPQHELELALLERARYFEAKRRNQLELELLEAPSDGYTH